MSVKTYNYYNKRAYVVGDIHGHFDIIKNQIKTYKITDSVIIFAGDIGLGFEKTEHYKQIFPKLNKVMKMQGNVLLFTRGNHDCLSKNFTTLTKRGWLKYDELSMDDMVLSFNPETKMSEWHKIDDIIIKDSEFIYTQKGQSLELEATENHRHLLQTKNGDFIYKNTKDITTYNSRDNKIIHGALVNNPEYNIKDDEIRIVAWLMTDGYYDDINHKYFCISQSKEHCIENIKTILSNLKCDFSLNYRKTRDKTIIIKGKTVKNAKNEGVFRLKTEFSKFVRDNLLSDKFKLPDWVYELSYRQLKIFIDTLLEANGTILKHKGNYMLFGTYEMLFQFQPLFCMCGYRCGLVQDNRGDWRLNICENNLSNILINNKPFKKEKYNDKVFCITTELSNFFVSLNGKCYFTGNCPQYFENELINYSNIKSIPDYSVINIHQDWDEEMKETPKFSILCVGGGVSIDRQHRLDVEEASVIEYKYWHPNASKEEIEKHRKKCYWSDELPFYDVDKLDEITKEGYNIEYVVSHTSPDFCYPYTKKGIEYWMKLDENLEKDVDFERNTMTSIYNYLINHKHILTGWYYGHFHSHYESYYDNVKFTLLDCEHHKWDMVEIGYKPMEINL